MSSDDVPEPTSAEPSVEPPLEADADVDDTATAEADAPTEAGDTADADDTVMADASAEAGENAAAPSQPSPPQPVPTELAPAEPTPTEPGAVRAAGVLVGKVVEATVTSIGTKETEVRLLDGRTGVVATEELSSPAAGQAIEGALLAREDGRGRVWLSVAWATKLRAWERIEAAQAEQSPLTGTITKKTKGGYVVDLGLRGFLPHSLLGSLAGDEASLPGREVQVLVTESDRDADRVVVSIRDLERRRRRAEERERIAALGVGDLVSGKVVSIAEYGAVLDLGGARGLIHRSELTWGRLGKVEDHVKVGDTVEVVVVDVNKAKKRIGLSLRQMAPDPFADVEVGAVLSSTITRVVEYGVFAKLDDGGAEGLVHISELSDVPGFRPDQLVTPGEQVMVKVIDLDRKKRRLSLSVRRVLVDD